MTFERPRNKDPEYAMNDIPLMTSQQATKLKELAERAYELDAFKPDLTSAEADTRVTALTAKLKNCWMGHRIPSNHI